MKTKFAFWFFFLSVNLLIAQHKEMDAASVSSTQDSLFKAYVYKNQLAYQEWERNLSNKRKGKITNSAIGGFIIGALVGIVVSSPIAVSCETLALPVAVFNSNYESDCGPIIMDAALIGGGIGLTVGLVIGNNKVKRFQPKFSF